MVEAVAKNAGIIDNPFDREELEAVLNRETKGIRDLFDKTVNEFGRSGIGGVIKKGLKKLK
jgi:hypothetical protein